MRSRLTRTGAVIPRTVKDVYRPSVIAAAADDRLLTAAERMRQDGISVAVVFYREAVAGVITERDLVRAVADRADLAHTGAADYMSPPPATVVPGTLLDEAARLMRELEVRHLPVVAGGEPPTARTIRPGQDPWTLCSRAGR